MVYKSKGLCKVGRTSHLFCWKENIQTPCETQSSNMEQTEVVKPESLDDLIKILHNIFENDSINVEEVQNIMESYESNPQDWIKYAKFDQYR